MIAKEKITWVRQSLRLIELPLSSKYQVRADKLNSEQVARYVNQMAAGDEFPPIQVAVIGKRLHVLDGHHRLAALRHLGHDAIEALVAPMTSKLAHAVAIEANVANGLPLCGADRRSIFKVYCDSGNHLMPKSKARKSLSVIARELTGALGRTLPKSTVANWLELYAPLHDGPMGGSSASADPDEFTRLEDMDIKDDLSSTLGQLERLYRRLSDADDRYRVREDLSELARKLAAEATRCGDKFFAI